MKKGPTFPPVSYLLISEQNQKDHPGKPRSWKTIQCRPFSS
jgi:hypothetical protein